MHYCWTKQEEDYILSASSQVLNEPENHQPTAHRIKNHHLEPQRRGRGWRRVGGRQSKYLKTNKKIKAEPRIGQSL